MTKEKQIWPNVYLPEDKEGRQQMARIIDRYYPNGFENDKIEK